ncbi:hypothetical protein T492DRAFT_1062879 [Pavlovales sp. CCMP2436]|nr:hypothetical protein T492DRAFT_1062879 [Pavlovales sp. CCMP2436]
MSGFELAVGGRLRLKGDAEPTKKKKKKRRDGEGGERDGGTAGPPDDAEGAVAGADDDEPIDGSGTVQTSGCTLMGKGTCFIKELAADDRILLTVVDRFRNTSSEEARAIRLVVGDNSASIEAPFSCDLTAVTSFRILKAIPDPALLAEARAASAAALKRQRRDEAKGELVTYEKLKDAGTAASGVWKTTVKVTERLGPGRTREDVLDYRCKQKADKHCK